MSNSIKKSYFFGGQNLGLKADIKRHMEEEKDIRQKIEQFEKENDENWAFFYRWCLNKLLESKAQLTSQIGKKNDR